jgi:hypothetical protein
MPNTNEFGGGDQLEFRKECTGCGGAVYTKFKKCHVCRAKKKPAKIVREDDVEGKYVREAEDGGALVLKVKVLGRPGYPDRWVLRGAKPLADFLHGIGFSPDKVRCAMHAELLLSQCFHMAEFKKQANSVFQPKQKTILPMLRKRGFRVDIVHG